MHSVDSIVRNLTYLYCAARSCMQAFRTWQPMTLQAYTQYLTYNHMSLKELQGGERSMIYQGEERHQSLPGVAGAITSRLISDLTSASLQFTSLWVCRHLHACPWPRTFSTEWRQRVRKYLRHSAHVRHVKQSLYICVLDVLPSLQGPA